MSQDQELEIRLQFLEEATEHLNVIESAMLRLATSKIEHQIDAVLRAAHSIKGGAAMMGFPILSDLAHRLEDFYKILKNHKPPIDAELQSLLLAAVDLMQEVITQNRQGTEVDEQWLENCQSLFEQLQARLDEVPIDEAQTLLLPEDGQDMVALIFETEVEGCLQRLASVLENPDQPCLLEEVSIMAQELSGLGEMLQLEAFSSLCASISQHLELNPDRVVEIAELALQAWRRSQAAVLVKQLDTLPQNITLAGEEQLEKNLFEQDFEIPDLAEQSSPTAVTKPFSLTDFSQSNSSEYQEQTVRVPIKQLDGLNEWFGELTIARNGINLYIERLRNLVRNLQRRVQTLEQSCDRFSSEQESAAISNASQLLPLQVRENMTRVQELTDDINVTLADSDRTVTQLNRTAKQLQTSLNQVRMRPFADLVSRFPRFVRELTQQYDKNVELKIYGETTPIDRSILEALSDPLRHLLRNAFGHGIEEHTTRLERGKPPQGVIEISATYQGDRTLITVSDDGEGIDLDKIRQRLAQMGLEPEEIATISEQKLLSMIFEPGFSTAGEVTSLSGRGVGLDVVRTNLRAIRGDIKVDTQLGVGTTFTIDVPLTLSVTRVLLAESKGTILAFPCDVIGEMLLLTPERVSTIGDRQVFGWKSSMTPLIRLSDWLEWHCPHQTVELQSMPLTNAPTVLMITQANNEWVALELDRCWGEQEVTIRQIAGATPQGESQTTAIALPPGFSGCTILGDGRVIPLVNASALLNWITERERSQTPNLPVQPSTISKPQPQKNTILVVDDSINVRRFLSLTLERAGYRVEQAQDGQDALEKLLSGLSINAVICDVDMPHLDGYGLLAQIKSKPAFEKLPFAMLTSRNSSKDRELASNLGAAAYFSKPYNEQELLQTLKQLLKN